MVEPPGGGPATVTTVDALIEDIHFRLPEFPPEAVGRKALAAGLSDLAAMGAEASEAYVVLGTPDGTEESFLLELHGGMTALAEECGVDLLGGDVNRAPVLLLSVTAVGREPDGGRLVSRAGASPGDVLVVTGELGGAAAALKLIEEGSTGDTEALIARQFAPVPRLAAGRALADAGATAMIDLSDGLGADAAHIAAASGVAVEVELERIPVQAGVSAVAGSDEAGRELAASGGEDYELLAAIPADALDAARAAVKPVPLTEIGAVTDGTGVAIRDEAGRELDAEGFKHF